jgi:hypothetical protein
VKRNKAGLNSMSLWLGIFYKSWFLDLSMSTGGPGNSSSGVPPTSGNNAGKPKPRLDERKSAPATSSAAAATKPPARCGKKTVYTILPSQVQIHCITKA